MSHRAKTLACLYLPWFRECTPALVFVCGAIRELFKEHTDAARLTCGRGLEEEVSDHAKVRGLLAHGGEGHGTSEPSERGTDCRVGRKRKEKNRKTEEKKINFSKERKTEGELAKQQHTTAALMCFSLLGENSRDVHSSSSPQTHPVFTQHLARRRRPTA